MILWVLLTPSQILFIFYCIDGLEEKYLRDCSSCWGKDLVDGFVIWAPDALFNSILRFEDIVEEDVIEWWEALTVASAKGKFSKLERFPIEGKSKSIFFQIIPFNQSSKSLKK